MFNVWAFFSSVSACGTVRCAGQQLRRFPCVVCVLAVSLQSPKCCCGHVFCSVLAGHSHYCQCWKSCETHFLQCKVCGTAESCINGYITVHLFQVGRKLLSSNVFSAAWRERFVFGVLVLISIVVGKCSRRCHSLMLFLVPQRDVRCCYTFLKSFQSMTLRRKCILQP